LLNSKSSVNLKAKFNVISDKNLNDPQNINLLNPYKDKILHKFIHIFLEYNKEDL